jgi:hypothetical protein
VAQYDGGADVSDDPVLAALARLEEGQRELREQVGALAQDQAMMFDALRSLQAALTPALARMEDLDRLLRALGLEVNGRSEQP